MLLTRDEGLSFLPAISPGGDRSPAPVRVSSKRFREGRYQDFLYGGEMKEIPLAGGLVALVDDADFELVQGYGWYAAPSRRTVYARAVIRGVRPLRCVRLHRLILDVAKGVRVDHKNLNGLDCQRANLRIATNAQNKANGEKYRSSRWGVPPTSPYKGVFWKKQRNKWCATIKGDTGTLHLGYFTSETNAALAYNKAALDHYGEFSRLNVIEEN
jgi:hypothetical protein